jgi:hypothetical protein
MSKQSVNIGTTANDGTGSPLRTAFDFINDNTDEVYALLGNGTTLSITGDVTMSAGAVTIANDAVTGDKIADDVALAGSPTTTTQSAGDNSTKIATTAYADNAVANAIDAAPAALDTLNELAASLNDDADFAGTMTTSLAGKLSTANGAVGTSNLADSAVTTAKITDANVTTAKIADDAVTADKLANSINTEIAANTAKTGITSGQASAITANTAKVTNATHTGDVTGATALTIANNAVTTAKIAADAVDGTKIADDSIDSEHYVDASIDAAHIASSAVTNAKINNGAVNMDKLSATIIVTESEGISSNDNDTTLPTSAAVKDYVDNATDNDTLAGLNNGDGNFVVGNGSAFVVESGATARTSIGLGTAGHIQFHCLGIGTAASTNSGQIDATTVYAGTFGLNADDKISFTNDTQIDFTVNGNNEMRLEADGDLHVDGDVIAASTTVSSDERLKENISTYKNSIDTINQLKGVSFEWKKDGKKSGGVIAQDVEKVLPELVGEKKSLKGEKSTLTVDYNGLVGVLIEAVKELSNKVEKLEKR